MDVGNFSLPKMRIWREKKKSQRGWKIRRKREGKMREKERNKKAALGIGVIIIICFQREEMKILSLMSIKFVNLMTSVGIFASPNLQFVEYIKEKFLIY